MEEARLVEEMKAVENRVFELECQMEEVWKRLKDLEKAQNEDDRS